MVIECKNHNLKTTGMVWIEIVDALHSKRQDLQIDGAIIYSNSGFATEAINKTKPKGIYLISIMKTDDSLVKAVIEDEIYGRSGKEEIAI